MLSHLYWKINVRGGNEKFTLTAYWNFSLYSLSLALTRRSSSAQTQWGKWVITGWYHNKDVQKALKLAAYPCLQKLDKMHIQAKSVPERLSLSVISSWTEKKWRRQQSVHYICALIDKSMISKSVCPSVSEQTTSLPRRHIHPNQWLAFIPTNYNWLVCCLYLSTTRCWILVSSLCQILQTYIIKTYKSVPFLPPVLSPASPPPRPCSLSPGYFRLLVMLTQGSLGVPFLLHEAPLILMRLLFKWNTGPFSSVAAHMHLIKFRARADELHCNTKKPLTDLWLLTNGIEAPAGRDNAHQTPWSSQSHTHT